MDKEQIFSDIKSKVEVIIEKETDLTIIYKSIVELLDKNIPYFHWTGIYLVDKGELVLGPYVGKSTEHTRIKIGEGICGQAADQKKTIIVDDVHQESNYLACSIETMSEIVVPIMAMGQVVGEIDVDSDIIDAFDEDDAELLEYIADLIVQKINFGT